MRLWHKDLIDILPRQQLLSQWRELCCIAKNIATNGTPNHLLVNKILDYSVNDFLTYTEKVISEMRRRGYKVSDKSYKNFYENIKIASKSFSKYSGVVLYEGWHNNRYLRQCCCNLQEKFDCGGITPTEWSYISDYMHLQGW
jgi:uncharacterized protein (TIGR02328 family)